MILTHTERQKIRGTLETSIPDMEEGPAKRTSLIILALVYDMAEAERELASLDRQKRCVALNNEPCFMKRVTEAIDGCQNMEVCDPHDEAYIEQFSELAARLRKLSDHFFHLKDMLVRMREHPAESIRSMEIVQ